MINRRSFLAASAISVLASSHAWRGLAAEKHAWKIAACDWSIGQRQQIEAFPVAKAIGLDGVQFSFGEPGGRYDLRKAQVRDEIAKAQSDTGVVISSLAMGVLNSVPYATDDRAEQWVADAVDVAAAIKQRVILLAFFGKGDIHGKADLQQLVIDRLKRVASAAQKQSVVLGIESWLSADDHLRILDSVGSTAVQVYYDTANMAKMGYDIYRDLRRLRGRICEIHCKENADLLGQGKIDFAKVRDALVDIGYGGWLVIESATPGGMKIPDAYRRNAEHLRQVFSAGS